MTAQRRIPSQTPLRPWLAAATCLVLVAVQSGPGQEKGGKPDPKAGRIAILDSFTGHTKPILAVVVTNGGKTLVSLSSHEIKRWDIATGKNTTTVPLPWREHPSLAIDAFGHPGWTRWLYAASWGPTAGAVSPDGNFVAVGKLVDKAAEKRVAEFSDFVNIVEFYDVTTGKKIGATPEMKYTSFPNSLTFSPNSKVLAFGENLSQVKALEFIDVVNSKIQLWNPAAGKHLGTLTGHLGMHCTCAFSADGQSLVSASADGTVKVWDLTTGETTNTCTEKKQSMVTAAAFSPDGKVVAYSTMERDLGALYPPERIIEPKAPGKKVVNKEKPPTLVKLVDAATGEAGKTFTYAPGESILRMAFNHDGKILAIVSNRPGDPTVGRIKLWNVETGKDLITLSLHDGLVCCMTFSPDGKLLATGGVDKMVRLWGMPEKAHTFEQLKLYNPILSGK